MDVITRFRHTYRDLCQVEPDALNKLYTDDVVFIDPITTHRGLPQVQEYFSNLLVHANSCEFDISDILECKSKTSQITHVANWTMTLVLKQKNKIITLDGTTQLSVKNDLIVYHKDYYDVGEMVYEHIPLLGFVIKRIKRKLAL